MVAFSYYGDPQSKRSRKRQYFEGILGNLQAMRKMYPNFIMWIYVEPELSKSLCPLLCQHPELDVCNIHEIPGLGNATKLFPMIWRFLPVLDPQVTALLPRDLDSWINQREATAVHAWLQSNKALHVMRDHPLHPFAILGGMWGIKMDRHIDKAMMALAFDLAIKDKAIFGTQINYSIDQNFLKK